jgi:hypothetical protein
MITRTDRLADFSTAPPTEGSGFHLLCEDHVGTYQLPYLCRWNGAEWSNANTGAMIEAQVIGWRPA